MTPFPAPSSSPLTLWPHVGCLSPQTSRPVRPELVVPSSLLLGACLPGVLSWLPLPASAPGPCLSWPFLGLCFPLCPLSLPLASSSRSGGTASSSLRLRSFSGPALSLLQPPSQSVASASHLPRLYPWASPLPLSNPSVPFSALPFLSTWHVLLGRRTPESQSSRASVPAPLCGRYLLTSPASPALVCNAKKEPANPQFPPTGPKRSQFVTSLFLILLFSPSFPPPFCWALSIGQKCFSLI